MTPPQQRLKHQHIQNHNHRTLWMFQHKQNNEKEEPIKDIDIFKKICETPFKQFKE